MTARAFADTNIVIYAEGSDAGKAQRATAIPESGPVVPVTADTIREAVRSASRYQISHWDSLIVAAALLAECETPYSEDLQHRQVFDDRLTVINPFAE
jgi:predicted nucleic acid-binding protein